MNEFRQIDPDAQFESMRARVPLYGTLSFVGKNPNFKGDSVGREWEYRLYIAGGRNSSQRAVWTYPELPSRLAARTDSTIPCEFSFDIFRTLKGEEGKGVFCSFWFYTRNWDAKEQNSYTQARDAARKMNRLGDSRKIVEQATQEIAGRQATPAEIDAFANDKSGNAFERLTDRLLAEKYGIFEVASKEVTDYHTQALDVPTALFKNAVSERPRPSGASAAGEESQPALRILVKCESGGQYLGVAKHDFYILDSEGSFALNFFKGAAGLWLSVIIVIGVAVMLSTYLSGVITLATTMFLFIAGLVTEYLKSIVDKRLPGGGPMEAFLRMASHGNPVMPLDATPGADLATRFDTVYRGALQLFLTIVPDVERLDWTNYVMEGFNVSSTELLPVTILLKVALYLLAWAILGYYLIKTREIATW
jgi:hypothetical protein